MAATVRALTLLSIAMCAYASSDGLGKAPEESCENAAGTHRVHDAVSSTALWIAASRAVETKREDSIFHDRFAETLAGEQGFRMMEEMGQGSAGIVPHRTRFFDDFVQASCHKEGLRQIVEIAAGMGTRAFRLKLPPGVTYFEIDKPALLEVKESLVAPMLTEEEKTNCKRVVVPADLESPPEAYTGRPGQYWEDRLKEHGFDPHTPTLWLIEGLTYYLSGDGNADCLQRVGRLSSPGSAVVMDVLNELAVRSASEASRLKERGSPFVWGHNYPEQFLAGFGFEAKATALSQLIVDREQRALVTKPLDPQVDPEAKSQLFFVTGTRRGEGK